MTTWSYAPASGIQFPWDNNSVTVFIMPLHQPVCKTTYHQDCHGHDAHENQNTVPVHDAPVLSKPVKNLLWRLLCEKTLALGGMSDMNGVVNSTNVSDAQDYKPTCFR